MRTGIRWTLSSFFILLLPVLLLLSVPRLNGFGPEKLKTQLQKRDVYQQISKIVQQERPAQSDETGESDDITSQSFVVLQAALTPEYLQQKSETVIDQTSAWVANQSTIEPKLSLNDLKERVLTSYPDAAVQLTELQTELAQAKQHLAEHPEMTESMTDEMGVKQSNLEFARFLEQADSLDGFTQGDFTLNLASPLQPLKQAYSIYSLALPILAIALAVSLVLVCLLCTSSHQRAKWAGWMLALAGLLNLVLVAGFSVLVLKIGVDMAAGAIPGQAKAAEAAGRAVIDAIFADYLRLELLMSAITIAVGVLLLATALIIGKRQHADMLVSKVANKPDLIPTAEKPGASKYEHTS